MASDARRVIIVGGGIGGMAAAVALQQAGLQVVVYERAGEMREVGAGLALWPNALKALDRLGLARAVACLGKPLGIGRILSWRGEPLLEGVAREELERRFGWSGTIVHRARLLEALVSAFDGELHLGIPCTGFRQEAEGVTASFAVGREDRGDLLIGADGLHSLVRAQLLGASALRYSGHTAYRAVTPFPLDEEMVGELWGRGSLFGVVPAVEGQIYWWAAIHAPEGAKDAPAGRKQELLTRFQGWHRPVEAVIQATEEAAILRHDLYDREPVQRWSNGRVTLLGDAAHPLVPNLGQGACLAIEDAVVLAKCLAECQNLASALNAYEARRVHRANSMVIQARWLGRLGMLANPAACRLRDALLRRTPARLSMRSMEQWFSFEA